MAACEFHLDMTQLKLPNHWDLDIRRPTGIDKFVPAILRAEQTIPKLCGRHGQKKR